MARQKQEATVRDHILKVRVTEDEHNTFRSEADKIGLSVSAFIRWSIKAAIADRSYRHGGKPATSEAANV